MKLTLATLRTNNRSAHVDTVGSSALLLGLAWPTVQVIASADILWPIGVGVLGSIGVFFGTAFATGVAESSGRARRATSIGWILATAAASVYWWRSLPAWAAGILTVVAVVGLGIVVRKEDARARAGTSMPEALLDALVELPETTPERTAELERAVTAYGQILRALDDATPDDPGPHPQVLAAAAEDGLRALARQTRQLVQLDDVLSDGAAPEIAALHARGERRLTALAAEIEALRDALLIVRLDHEGGTIDALRERVEALNLTADALEELAEIEAG